MTTSELRETPLQEKKNNKLANQTETEVISPKRMNLI